MPTLTYERWWGIKKYLLLVIPTSKACPKPVLGLCLSYLALNVAIVGAVTTLSGDAFHGLMSNQFVFIDTYTYYSYTYSLVFVRNHA